MVDTGKKRKHNDELGSERKKKKVAADSIASSKPCQIKVSSIVQPQVSPPVIATTSGIAVSKDTKFNTYSRAPTKRPRHGASDLLLHSTSHRTLDYSAREDKPKGGQPLLKHYIGLFDPASGQLQLVESKKMVIRGSVRAQQAPEEDMQSQKLSNTMYDLRTELGQAFGTKKAKKALAAITENAINPGKPQGDGQQTLDSSEKALMDSIKDVTMSVATREDLQSAMDAAKPVPRGNYEADEIQDVYRPEELIGKDILELIQVNDWAKSVKKNEDIQLRSRFVAHRINRIGSGESAVTRLRLLRYLYFVMLFYLTARKGKDKGSREVLKKDKLIEELSPAPPPVIESIRRKFSDKGIMRKQHVDLLMTHCCVFACILDNFETNTWDLKEDFGLDQKTMTQYFMEIGAKIKRAKVEGRTDSIAQLKLPLVFPKMRQGRR
ncbi:DNA-directed RNA polymerase I subunit rpa49 [Cytospora mali]|uniref:DNA-directed RNA polymerase I subunit rpa49 n=1 Tax=Cytospora mali TaxID=578113 RepID=A0A194VNR9_CYTMA|nr:DNA-directed RNA polymerase I subunit rpa49 [Valsa mali]